VMAAASATPTVFDQVVQRRIEPKPTTLARVGVADVVSAAVAGAGAGMPATLTFTGAGRLSVATTVRQIDITGAVGARRLTLVLTPAGGVRMCDPAVSLATNPQGCS
jgi:type IV fimbrial biogenesis protein FimT